MGTFIPDDGVHRCPECRHIFDHLHLEASVGNLVEIEGMCGNTECDVSLVEYRKDSGDIDDQQLQEFYDNYC